MKIIHAMPDIDKEASGPSYSVVRLCESLIQLAADSRIALVGGENHKSYVHSFPKGVGPARLGRSPLMRKWLREQVASGNVDVVHNHSLWMMPNVYPGWATKGTPVPYIVSPRGTLSPWALSSGSKIKRFFWPFVQRPSMAHVTCFHATADAEYEDIRRMGYRQPVAVIPNGIDIPDLQPRTVTSTRTLLFLGRLHPVKGVDFLLRAWKVLAVEFPDWSLKIVGPDNNDTARSLRALADNLTLPRVEFAGPVYGAEKLNVYQASDLYVLPTHSENFAMTVAEALACGAPVVVSQGAPWSGVLGKGAGWWPEIGEGPLLATLRQAMAIPRRDLALMGQAGRQWMADEFSWGSVAERMLATYSWVLGRGDRPACVRLD